MRKFLAILLQSIGVLLVVLFVVGATVFSQLHFSYIQLPVSHLLSPALSTLAVSICLIIAGKIIQRGIKYTPSTQISSEKLSE